MNEDRRSGWGTIRRKSGRRKYEIRLTLPDGRRVDVPGHESLEETRRILARLRDDFDRGEHLGIKPVQRTRFEDFAEEYLRVVASRHTAATVQSETSKIRGLLIPAFRGRWLDEIGRTGVERFIARRAAEGASAATRNRDASVLSAMFKCAVGLNQARENPVLGVERVREEKREIPFLDLGAQDRLIAACSPPLRPLVHVVLRTGLRESEALSLTWGCVDFRRRVIRVPKTKNKEPREVPLPEDAEAALRELHASRGPDPLDPSVRPDRVFAHLPSRWVGNLQRMWKRATAAAGLGVEFTFHDLRRVALSTMMAHGLPLTALLRVSGHKSLTAAARYLDFAPGAAAETARAVLETALKRQEPASRVAS